MDSEQKERAREHFETGNKLLLESAFLEAAEAYRKALQHWDHPGVHYNLALALLSMEKYIQAYEHFVEATRDGPAPLAKKDRYESAVNQMKLLAEQKLARLTVECEEKGAIVKVNGRLSFKAPGAKQEVLMPGDYEIVASSPGLIPDTRTIQLSAGERAKIAVDPMTVDEAEGYRWARWKPWAVLLGGVGVIASGGVFHWRGIHNVDRFDSSFDSFGCAVKDGGCPQADHASVLPVLRRGRTQQKIALILELSGTVLLATGAVLLYLNRPQVTDENETASFAIAPLVSPDVIGLAATSEF